jgi:hypothetical protein
MSIPLTERCPASFRLGRPAADSKSIVKRLFDISKLFTDVIHNDSSRHFSSLSPIRSPRRQLDRRTHRNQAGLRHLSVRIASALSHLLTFFPAKLRVGHVGGTAATAKRFDICTCLHPDHFPIL